MMACGGFTHRKLAMKGQPDCLHFSQYPPPQTEPVYSLLPIEKRSIPLQRVAGGVIAGEHASLKCLFNLHDSFMHANFRLEAEMPFDLCE